MCVQVEKTEGMQQVYYTLDVLPVAKPTASEYRKKTNYTASYHNKRKTDPVSGVFILPLPEQVASHDRAMHHRTVKVLCDRLKPLIRRIQELQRFCEADID